MSGPLGPLGLISPAAAIVNLVSKKKGNSKSAVTQPSTTTQGVVGASPSGPQGGY